MPNIPKTVTTILNNPLSAGVASAFISMGIALTLEWLLSGQTTSVMAIISSLTGFCVAVAFTQVLDNYRKTLHRKNRELEQLAADLQTLNAQLTAQNHELDAFAHTVAHDLKTPLTTVLGYSQLLATRHATLAPDVLSTHLQSIDRNAARMTRIIDELLLLSSLRHTEHPTTPIDMGEIIHETCDRLAHDLNAQQVTLALPAAWPVALGYGPWLEEVWTNYLSNALKYGGQPPRITLGAEPLPDGRSARFWVRDNGAGLSAEAQARLFTTHTRLDQARAEGHGLGLSIVKRIITRLNGTVGVESTQRPGEGCVFYFTLPLASPTAPAPEA